MIDFWGVGFDVAERMDLLPALRQVGYFIKNVRFVDEHGRTRSEMRDVFQRALGDRFVSLPRGDLARAIFDTVAGEIEVLFGESVTAINEDSLGVNVSFEHAAPRRFDLVAGCDGLHSAVRATVFGPKNQFERYLGYYSASFLADDYPLREERTYLSYAAPGRQISRYALRGNRTAFFFVFARDQPLGRRPGEAEAKQLLSDTFARDQWVEIPAILERLEKCDELYFDSVSQIRMPRWSRGRTVLLGDAAYCPSLLAGEGAAFAMAGAYILAGELKRAGGDHTRAFPAYEDRFRTFIERKQRTAEQFAGSFAPKTRFGLFVRDLILRASVFPPIENWLMRQFVADPFELPSYEELQ
jgi:2-polyprenyl-6-methoxyphenol hydroxylase-like FAD-dependent oxidoreductase